MSNEVFDCVILSGGGAKGSFGAGAAYALFSYYDFKKVRPNVCYFGASAGALNACVLACHGHGQLKDLWLNSVSNRSILGLMPHWLKSRLTLKAALSLLKREPFALYSNEHLAALIRRNADFGKLAGKHLVLLTTNYTRGELGAFYYSELFDAFVAKDREKPFERQRLKHFRRIDNQETLVSALLASAAIPVFFPPVKIDGEYYVDGGLGNNTPTSEAAYFLRHLSRWGGGVPRDAYCVEQDPRANVADLTRGLGFFDILQRTVDLAGRLHMEPIVSGWDRINRETESHKKRVKEALALIGPTTAGTASAELTERVEELGKLGGEEERIIVPIIRVHPEAAVGDTLDFAQEKMRQNVRHGYSAMLGQLEDAKKITGPERGHLARQPLA